MDLSRVHWGNLFSIRFYLLSAFSAFLVGILPMWALSALGVPDGVTVWVFWILMAVFGFLYLTLGDELDCPACGKNVKIGYDVCHHCGHEQS